MSNYFKECKTVAAIKKEYRRLAMLHHPDIGGDTATMQEINSAYHAALKNQTGKAQHGTDGKERTYKYNGEHENAIISKIDEILSHQLAGIEIWLIGLWVWVKGDTKPHRETLGKNGLQMQWHNKRKCWYWKPYEGKNFYNSSADFGDLADQYGAKNFTNAKQSTQRQQVKG